MSDMDDFFEEAAAQTAAAGDKIAANPRVQKLASERKAREKALFQREIAEGIRKPNGDLIEDPFDEDDCDPNH